MHEVSLMEHALETAFERSARHGGGKILSVKMRVGAISGVVPEALEFAFEALTPGTLAEGAELLLERIQAVCYCGFCEREFGVDDFVYLCPNCEMVSTEIRSGREFELVSLEVSPNV